MAECEARGGTVLQFAPWESSVNEGFWHRFADLKLDWLGLDERPIEICGYFVPNSHAQLSSHMQLHFESLPANPAERIVLSGNRNKCPVPGVLYNTNTKEDFTTLDKSALLQSEADKIWGSICSGEAEKDCRLLNRFILISYADLKKWTFVYWFAFPGLKLQQPAYSTVVQPASSVFSKNEAAGVLAACINWRESINTSGFPFFLLHITSEAHVTSRSLSDWEEIHQEGSKVFLAFYDPCHLPTNPGWPLRNLLVLAAVRWHVKAIKVLCYRERRGKPDLDQCLVIDVNLADPGEQSSADYKPEAVGWEKNARGKLGPRMQNLASSMDPTRLATAAADLNLKLMRWRFLPSLDLSRLSSTKCLLIGSGTLGCQVARGLMAWGIRRITMVDSGRVAMSNPVRQSLYFFDDCLEGGRPKAEAAADCLRRICPEVDAKGEQFSIPMPGHYVGEEQVPAVMEDYIKLKGLVDDHDAIFLLTDTRESRWLPTLLCAAANKVAITVALGFDSFLVMRHGCSPPLPESSASSMADGIKINGRRLGCYFCNDVVAPVDSTLHRTLDQQCTVSRPGLAPIASAFAVEMTVNLLQHPLGINAPADEAIPIDGTVDNPFGILPHQIRGFLSQFSQLIICGEAFDRCTACSEKVVSEFHCRGFDFVLKAMNAPSYLEDLTGLTELINSTKSLSLDWEEENDNTEQN